MDCSGTAGKQAGGQTALILLMGMVFTYLLLVARYESWSVL